MPTPAVVLAMCAGAVISGDQRGRSDTFLLRLPAILAAAAGSDVLRPFAASRGDVVEGALRQDADPFKPILAAALEPDGVPLCWAVVADADEVARARAAAELAELVARDERLVILSGDPLTDALLADLAPVLDALVGDMTSRQRDIARRILVHGRRQAAVAAELGVSRATISVAVARGRVRDLGRAVRGLHGLFLAGIVARDRLKPGPAPPAGSGPPVPIGSAAG